MQRLSQQRFSFSLRHHITFWLVIYALIIGQDYIYSVLRHTGFYWSEVLVFNSYWLLFIPISFFIKKLNLNRFFKNKNLAFKIGNSLFFTFVFSLVHLLFFTCLITCISQLFFTPPHRFMTTLITSVSNDFYLTILVYFFIIYVFTIKKKKKAAILEPTENTYPKTLTIKQGNTQFEIDIANILYFESNKPYTTLYTEEAKYLLPQSLKMLEKSLNPEHFLRVHRSTIIHKNYIATLISRKNGDYDVVLKNNQTLRMSRHYRKNWKQLIQ